MDATVNARVAPIISGKNPHADLAPGNALVAGMRLREFEIVETLGEGGFSIVYGARDLQLMREVAIKEYIPISLAGRVASTTVRIRSEHNRETFEAGLSGFINEARLLAQFKHPGLVEVLQFWEENGTAYMVMPRYTGKTLRSVLKDMGGRGDEPWLRGIVAPVLDVLELLHSRNVFHRDIAPDNILIKNDGTPVLLDLGSAREVVTGLQKAITVVVKPGYAPIEQYSSDFALPQGPWTDVYAVGALLHFAILGCPPPASISRIMKDSLQPLAGAGHDGYSREFLTAIDRALALQPGDRPQSIAELRELLRVTKHDKTVIDLRSAQVAVAPPPMPAVTALPEPIVGLAALDPQLPGSEDERTVIVSAQEVAALVQQLAGAKAAAASPAPASAAAATVAPASSPVAAAASQDRATLPATAQTLVAELPPLPAAPPASDAAPAAVAPVAPAPADVAAITLPHAAVTPVPVADAPADTRSFASLSGVELTLEPMERAEPEAPDLSVASPAVAEWRIEPVSMPPPRAAAAADSDATLVMPAPPQFAEAARAVAAKSPPAAATHDATVVMAAPDALALARSVAAAAPAPVAANANEPTVVLPAPVSPAALDPLAHVPQRESAEANSFPEMEDLLSGRLATESRPVAVPVIRTPAKVEAAVTPPPAASRPWLLPVAIGSVVVVLAAVLVGYLLSDEAPVTPPPLVAEAPAAARAEASPAAAAEAAATAVATQPANDPLAAATAEQSAVSSTPDPNAASPAAAETTATVPVDPNAGASVAAVDPNQVLAPLAAPSETTSAGFESPGQTIAPAVSAPPAEAVAATAAPATTTTTTAATSGADAVRTVDLTAAAAAPSRSGEAPVRPREGASSRARKETKVATATTGNVKLSIQPWGEVWINGSLKGVSPPMRFLQLEPGTYNVELRNPGLQSLRRQLVVTAGQPAAIEHRFQPSGGATQ
ncbi:MAG: hypothetical protein ABT27_22235 [Lysobacteraceae bacterium SCN 69-25]|nr:MAG: hypothetical protein ABT27_22235 [Xanthomonadaceae bacterium SCN 69-25]